MKRFQVIFDDHAIEDLAAIRDYISTHAPDTAIAFVERLIDEIEGSLEMFPHRQPHREATRLIPFRIWRLPIGRYRCIYSIDDDRMIVRVLGVQHGGRNTWP